MTELEEIETLRAELGTLEARAARADELRARERELTDEIAVATETSQRPALLAERDQLRARVMELEDRIVLARADAKAKAAEKPSSTSDDGAAFRKASVAMSVFGITFGGMALLFLVVVTLTSDVISRDVKIGTAFAVMSVALIALWLRKSK